MRCRAIIVSPHVAKYADPIAFHAGERVAVHQADAEFPGWHWCTNALGKEGWVHASFLSATVGNAVGLLDYSAAELTVSVGDEGVLLEKLGGWVYFQADDGAIGWVPENHVRVAV